MKTIFFIESKTIPLVDAQYLTYTLSLLSAKWEGDGIAVNGALNIEELERTLRTLDIGFTTKEA